MPIETVKAYRTTRVNWARTQAQIVQLLEKKGIKDIQFTFLSADKANQNKIITEEGISVLDTRFIIPYSPQGIGVRILVPNIREENRNQMHRLLLWYLKSKFEASAGISASSDRPGQRGKDGDHVPDYRPAVFEGAGIRGAGRNQDVARGIMLPVRLDED